MQKLDTTVLDLVKSYGLLSVSQAVQRAIQQIAEINARPLPEGFRRFGENDWAGYAGAEALPDGSDPILGEAKILVDLDETNDGVSLKGTTDTYELVISGLASERVGLGLYLSNGSCYVNESATVEQALALATLLQSAPMPTSLALLQNIGFAKQ